MLTFEKDQFMGTQGILEKLTVRKTLEAVGARMSILDRITGSETNEEAVRAEPTIPKSPTPNRYYRCAAVRSAGRYPGNGDWCTDGM